ncbi:MAG: hypothetical protein IT428_30920 [Planctomycetaceae bacterium]|nr:hypothetical protein [Planctomycetaceae bacterium]
MAQPPNVDDVRIITGDGLYNLSYIARSSKYASLFPTLEFRTRLSEAPPTTSILIMKPSDAQSDRVWYTDRVTTKPIPIQVTRIEHTIVVQFADGGIFRIVGMRAGPRTIQETLETKGPDGEKTTVTVSKVVVDMPTDQEVKDAVALIDGVGDKKVRDALRFAAGARFAELFPPEAGPSVPQQAMELANEYRGSVLHDAVSQLASKPESNLPSISEPLFFGKSGFDALNTIRAVEGTKPTASFETSTGNYVAAWDKATLVLVRQPKGASYSADFKLRFSDEWTKRLDARAIEVPTRPSFDYRFAPDKFSRDPARSSSSPSTRPQ